MTIVEGNTGKPVPGVYVIYYQGCQPKLNELINFSDCDSVKKCGMTGDDGVGTFKPRPHFQDSLCAEIPPKFWYM